MRASNLTLTFFPKLVDLITPVIAEIQFGSGGAYRGTIPLPYAGINPLDPKIKNVDPEKIY